MQVSTSNTTPKLLGPPVKSGGTLPVAGDDASATSTSDGPDKNSSEQYVFECCEVAPETPPGVGPDKGHEGTSAFTAAPAIWNFQLQLSALKVPVENTNLSDMTEAPQAAAESEFIDAVIGESVVVNQDTALPSVPSIVPLGDDTAKGATDTESVDRGVENLNSHTLGRLRSTTATEELQNRFVPMQSTATPEQTSKRSLRSLTASGLAPATRSTTKEEAGETDSERSDDILSSRDVGVSPETRRSIRVTNIEPSAYRGSGASSLAGPSENEAATTIGHITTSVSDAVDSDKQDQNSITVGADVKVTVVRQETHFAPALRPSVIEQVGKATVDAALSMPPLTDAGIAVSKDPVIKVLELHLQPNDLGTITVRMQLSNGRVTLSLGVEGKDLALQIERDRDDLSKYLQATGLTLDGVDVKVLRAEPTQAQPQQRSEANGQSSTSGGSVSAGDGRQGGQSGLWQKAEREENARQHGAAGSDAGATSTTTSSAGLYL